MGFHKNLPGTAQITAYTLLKKHPASTSSLVDKTTQITKTLLIRFRRNDFNQCPSFLPTASRSATSFLTISDSLKGFSKLYISHSSSVFFFIKLQGLTGRKASVHLQKKPALLNRCRFGTIATTARSTHPNGSGPHGQFFPVFADPLPVFKIT